ncbi:MAG TPA: polysaccharide deacetylase family protein [Polyangia bacterium]|nr:polysaccharide deacetylase family protein [Polyangia bacterium]
MAAAPGAPSLALTFDDGPDAVKLGPAAVAESDAILAALAEAKLKSVLFVEGKRVDSPEGLAAVAAWGKAGHLVANHSYSHHNLSAAKTTVADFEADVVRNEELLRGLPGFTRLFRFPFLNEGDTASKRDAFRAFLRARHYRSGRATIDASDWYYDQRFRQWLVAHPGGDPGKFRDAYLAHLLDRAQYYDGLSRRVVGRSVKHTLILHVNAVNAAFLPDVIRMFRSHGWKLIDAARAFRDPVFDAQPRVLPAGQSLIWSIAKEKDAPDLRYPGEDAAYEKPILDAAGL